MSVHKYAVDNKYIYYRLDLIKDSHKIPFVKKS